MKPSNPDAGLPTADDVRGIIPRSTPAQEGCDWPDKPFTFHDEPGEHDPCYVVMPDGAMLSLNHHAGEGVDIARAKFIVSACNAALSTPSGSAGPQAEAWELQALRDRVVEFILETDPFGDHFSRREIGLIEAACMTATATNEPCKPARDDLKRCAICGFIVDPSFEATKPTIDFTMAGRTKTKDSTASASAGQQATALAVARIRAASYDTDLDIDFTDTDPVADVKLLLAAYDALSTSAESEEITSEEMDAIEAAAIAGTPLSASAGPQAEAVTIEQLALRHLQTWSSDIRLVSMLTEFAKELLRAHPQSQQADGRWAVIDPAVITVPFNPCLAKLRPGEPFFVLLGRDKQAPNAVMTWANDREAAEGKSAWTDQAREVYYAMVNYRAALQQSDGPSK